MLKRFKYALGATLIAASQLATADMAEVKISNLTLSVSGGEWWYWLPTGVDWVSPSAGATTALLNPSFADGVIGWHGEALVASAADGASLAQAQLGAKTSSDLNGVTAMAAVQASGTQGGWAFAKVFDGQIMVGGNATVTVSATLDSILASGAMSQANAYIEFCSFEDVCSEASYAEAFVDGASSYTGPSILTASWTNPGATTWAKMRIGLTASADAVSAVPEPATTALWLGGLAALGAIVRRRRA